MTATYPQILPLVTLSITFILNLNINNFIRAFGLYHIHLTQAEKTGLRKLRPHLQGTY